MNFYKFMNAVVVSLSPYKEDNWFFAHYIKIKQK